MTPLSEWQNFYIIVGSAAGGLTGLQFVTMALVADMPMEAADQQAGEVFSTPSIVHFGAVLLLSAVLVMPLHGLTSAACVWAVAGLAGIAYTLLVARRMRRQTTYKTVAEDWFFRILLPLAAYFILAAAAFLWRLSASTGLYLVAAAALLLLFVGIHNTWDNVTYLVLVKRHELKPGAEKA